VLARVARAIAARVWALLAGLTQLATRLRSPVVAPLNESHKHPASHGKRARRKRACREHASAPGLTMQKSPTPRPTAALDNRQLDLPLFAEPAPVETTASPSRLARAARRRLRRMARACVPSRWAPARCTTGSSGRRANRSGLRSMGRGSASPRHDGSRSAISKRQLPRSSAGSSRRLPNGKRVRSSARCRVWNGAMGRSCLFLASPLR